MGKPPPPYGKIHKKIVFFIEPSPQDQLGNETEQVLSKQEDIEYKVREYSSNLYTKRNTQCSVQEIKTKIGIHKKISKADRMALEEEVTIREVSRLLAKTRNNITPGKSLFTGAFFEV